MNKTYSMKRISTILTALFLLVGFSTAVTAQSSDQATVTATANVAADLTAQNVIDLDFGNILIGSSKFLDAGNQSFNPSADGVSGGESFGVAQIDYVPGEIIDIQIVFPTTLSANGVSGNSDMDFDNSYDGNGFSSSGINAILVDDTTIPDGSENQSLTILTGALKTDWSTVLGQWTLSDFQVPDGGTIYAIIGGKVTADPDQAVGVYTGSITVNVAVPD